MTINRIIIELFKNYFNSNISVFAIISISITLAILLTPKPVVVYLFGIWPMIEYSTWELYWNVFELHLKITDSYIPSSDEDSDDADVFQIFES